MPKKLQETQWKEPKPLLFKLRKIAKDQYSKLSYNWTLQKRSLMFMSQRFFRREGGWDDSALWALDVHLAQVIYPRLLRFQQTRATYLDGGTEDDWDKILEEMCDAFYMLGTYERDDYRYDDEKIERGLDLFREYYLALWD